MSLFGWMMCAKGGPREGFLFDRDRQDRSSRRRFGYFVYVTRETRRERHGSGERASAGVVDYLGYGVTGVGASVLRCEGGDEGRCVWRWRCWGWIVDIVVDWGNRAAIEGVVGGRPVVARVACVASTDI